jgi:tartrate dehydratase alpha subunit/fumarate hydratase class I-like protein
MKFIKIQKEGQVNMDIKEQITTAVEKITKDEKLQEQFKKDPVKTVEQVLGVSLPDDVVNKIVDGVKAKLSVDKASDVLGSIKKLF